MTIVKESSCITSVIEDLIKFHVPTAKQVTDVGAEASFILPSSETSKFPDLFDSLDGQYNIDGYISHCPVFCLSIVGLFALFSFNRCRLKFLDMV